MSRAFVYLFYRCTPGRNKKGTYALTNRCLERMKTDTGRRKNLKRRRSAGSSLDRLGVNNTKERVSRVIGVSIAEASSWPFDAQVAGRPDSEERAAFWRCEPPPLDPVFERSVHYGNKEFADDLCDGVRIKVGWTESG